MSDNEVVRRVREGQVREFRILVDRYQQGVFRLAYRILGRREDAEDAAQDTFIRAFRSIHTYSDTGAFWPWVRRLGHSIPRIRHWELFTVRVDVTAE